MKRVEERRMRKSDGEAKDDELTQEMTQEIQRDESGKD